MKSERGSSRSVRNTEARVGSSQALALQGTSMKSICLFAFFAVLLAAVRPARTVADELDDLLYGEPAPAQQSTEPVAVQPERPLALDLIERDSASYSDQSRWRPAVNAAPARISVNKTASGRPTPSANPKPAEALPPNPVPEPSAVILGSLALLYFLIFGRRRRLG